MNSSSDIIKLFENIKGPVPRAAFVKLVDWGLIPPEGVLKCPNGHNLVLKECERNDGWIWRCYAKYRKVGCKARKCDYKLSIRSGTFFDKSKLSICQILLFVFMWIKNVSLDLIMTESKILGRNTGVDWNNFCREIVLYSSFQTTIQIGGIGHTVEIDESKIGKRKYNRGHPVEGQWVFGGVERGSNKCFIVPVEDRSRETLLPLIKKYILPATTIISDFWKAYDTLSDEGYEHFKVNHTLNFVDPVSQQHTNTIEGLWRHLKASLPTYNRRKVFFNGYIQKYTFLKWCKANNKCSFLEFLKYAGQLYNAANYTNADVQEMYKIMASEEAFEFYSVEEEEDV